MSSLQHRIAADRRLETIINATAKLKAELCELSGLRDRIRRAQLAAPRVRRIKHRSRRI